MTDIKKCRCGLPLAEGLTPCAHCDTVCVTKGCKRCESLDDLEKDASYYHYN